MSVARSLEEIASLVEGELLGRSEGEIHSVAGLREAAAGQLSFLSNAKYRKLLTQTGATAVLVSRDWSETVPNTTLIRVEDPDKAFAEITRLFVPPPVSYEPGIHPTAVIAESASLGQDVHVGPHVVIEEGAVIGDRCVLLAGVLISRGATLGKDALLHAGAILREHVVVGDRVILHNYCVIGSDGFGYTVNSDGSRTKVPQVGIVRVGDDVEIGAQVCVDRARFGETRIGHGVKIDNLVQIAHNVVIGDHAVLVSQVGISGSSVVEEKAILAGQVGVAGHLTIGTGAVVGAQGGVTKDVAPGEYVWGTPAATFKKYSKNLSNINRLSKLVERVAELEKHLKSAD